MNRPPTVHGRRAGLLMVLLLMAALLLSSGVYSVAAPLPQEARPLIRRLCH